MLSLNLFVALTFEIVIGTLELKSQSVKHFNRSILMVSGVVLMHFINCPSGEKISRLSNIYVGNADMVHVFMHSIQKKDWKGLANTV